jgi:uncharacterized protein (TIGR02145 family)
MKQSVVMAFLIMLQLLTMGQSVGIGTSNPHPSAQLDVTSNNQGLLPPRMTFSQRNAILNPAAGLIIWCTDCLPKGETQVFNGSEWTNMIGDEAAVNYVRLPSVTIGTQVWTTKNLDVDRYRNGDPRPQVTNATQWASLTTGAWCWYNNDSATYAAKYGRLYNWYAVNDQRGIAPTGWHVPNETEWTIVVKFIDPNADTNCVLCNQSNFAGGSMKITGLDYWISPNYGATNSSSLTILPSGGRYYDGSFISAGYYGLVWSSEMANTIESWNRFFNFSTSYFYKGRDAKKTGCSVRLVRD